MTTISFLDFLLEQLNERDGITHKKMFGEYMVYSNGKPIFLVCNDTVFVKQHDVVKHFFEESETGFPYTNAKEHFIVDVENRQLLSDLIDLVEPITPFPKPRKKNISNASKTK